MHANIIYAYFADIVMTKSELAGGTMILFLCTYGRMEQSRIKLMGRSTKEILHRIVIDTVSIIVGRREI